MNREELKRWRQERKLSWAKLARLLGVHWTTIARWERGERPIPAMLSVALKGLERELGNGPVS